MRITIPGPNIDSTRLDQQGYQLSRVILIAILVIIHENIIFGRV